MAQAARAARAARRDSLARTSPILGGTPTTSGCPHRGTPRHEPAAVSRVQLLLVLLVLLVLQFYVRPRSWNARISPDFLLIGLMLYAMRSGPGAAAVAGFLVGLIEDTLTPARFGAGPWPTPWSATSPPGAGRCSLPTTCW